MDYQEINRRLLSAEKILFSRTTSRQKLVAVRQLIKGINPRLDKALASCSQALKKVDQIKKGQVIDLTFESLPTKSKEEKKRKKAILLFLRSWRQLKNEVKRVKKELASQKASKQTVRQTTSRLTRIIHFAKGPLGLITLLAVAVVVLQSMAVKIVISNQGCQPIKPLVSLPFTLPGLRLPQETIPDGGQAIAQLPPLKLTVDGRQRDLIKITALKLSMNFTFEETGIELLFNDQPLLGQLRTINLSQYPEHQLVISCP